MSAMDHNLVISKFLHLENSSYAEIGRKYFNMTLSRMLEEGLNVDVTINANGGSVKAHKSVLMSVSPVLNAMFMHSMKEQLTSTVDLPDISLQGLELFLVLVYALNDHTAAPQELNKSINEHFDELFEACHKYQVGRLASTMIVNLKFHLTPDNCWDYYHRSEVLYEGSDSTRRVRPWSVVQQECWGYILNHYEEVVESESFVSEMQTHPKTVQKFVQRLL